MPDITLVTRNAQSADDLSDADYRDIYAELRQMDLPIKLRRSLRQFAALVGEPPSIAYWSKYEGDPDMRLSRLARNRLRAAIGPSELPPTVADAIAGIHPDAAVWRVGAPGPACVVLLITDPDPVDLHVNHTVSLLSPSTPSTPSTASTAAPDPAPQSDVTPVTPPRDRHTVSLPSSIYLPLDAARKQAGLTWPAYLARLQELAEKGATNA
jgi:hypothetical protein